MISEPVVNLVQTSIKLAVPLILAALGEMIVERAGVINVGIDGMMLVGACAAFGVASTTAGWPLAVVAAAIAGIVMAATFAFAVLKFRADQVVVGTAVNILALGITGVYVLNRSTATAQDSMRAVSSIPHFHLAYHGHPLLEMSGLAIAAYLLVPICWFYLSKTTSGLRLAATGEYPAAAEDAGINVPRLRLAALVFGGLMAGLAGAYLSIDNTVTFGEGMTGGMGFVALAVVIVGRWSPLGVLFASLLFSTASALQFDFQALHLQVPQQALLALPYVVTLVALIARAGRAAAPAALGQAYASRV